MSPNQISIRHCEYKKETEYEVHSDESLVFSFKEDKQ